MQISPYFILIVFLSIITLGILVMTHRQLEQKAAKEVFIAVLLVLFALIFFGISLLLTEEAPKFIFHELKFLPLSFLAYSTLSIYLEFTDKSHLLSRRKRALLCVIPCTTVILALTNGWHHLFRSDIYVFLHKGVYYVGASPSLWYWIYSVYSYGLYFVGIVTLTNAYIKKPPIYRGQVGLMISTSIFAIAVNLASVLGLFRDVGDAGLISCSVVSIMQYITIVKYSGKHTVQLARNIIIDGLDSPVLIFDHNHLLVDFNKSASEMLSVLLPELSLLKYSAGETVPEDTVISVRADDGLSYYSVSDKPLYDKRGQFAGRVIVLSDITGLKETLSELKHVVTHDYLTGLINRHAFHQKALELSQADLPVAFICINISGMKLFNDIFGPEFGDKVIKRTAQVIERECGQKNLCARLNGDEFCVVLKNAYPETAEIYIENICNKLLKNGQEKHDIYIATGLDFMTGMDCDAELCITMATESMRKNTERCRQVYAREFMRTLQNSLKLLRDTTGQRMDRIISLCGQVAMELLLTAQQQENLALLSVTHDIGLISMPPLTIQNIGNLTNEQWEEMKLHTVKGYNIALSTPEFSGIAKEILSHHERYDGYGYPNGLKSEEIPILSRILTAVEYYVDTAGEKALTMIQKGSGTQFDPLVVRAIVALEGSAEKNRD